ncbi:MAG: hypothetical protein ABUL47_06250, partial [Leifsonia sp.]
MARAIHSVSDWTDEEIAGILQRAGELADGPVPPHLPDALVGMCFFQTSMRTRIGFESAAHRLGLGFVEAVDRRSSAESMPESIEDTIRVISGYADALIVRSSRPSRELHQAARTGTPWLNAGDAREHPTQALIDVFAMERLLGPISSLRIALVGDMRMRSARSLHALLDRRPAADVTLVTVPPLLDGERAAGFETIHELPDWQPDVVYLAGIPHQAVTESVRTQLRLDRSTLDRLSERSIVLSPLPVIDEIASNARTDSRVRW